MTGVRSAYGPDQCLTGVSAALAEARELFRRSAPHMSWSEVTARANVLRTNEPMTLLQAISVIHNQILSGK
jgi:hypothetical protein